MSDSIPLKLCKYCGEQKPATLDFFSRDKSHKDELTTACKECNRKRALQWQRDNHDRYLARQKKWSEENRDYKREQDRQYAAEHREEANKKAQDWYYANPEQAKKQRDKWYQENKTKAHAAARAWAKAHPEYRKAADARHRARKLAADGKYSVTDILDHYDTQSGLCGYCGIRLYGKYDVDHYIPLTRGGSNYPDNLILACPSCNRSKNNKLFEEWVLIRGW